MNFLTVGSDAVAEFTEKKSVFRGYAFFTPTEADAAARIEDVRRQNGQATHNVYAYTVRAHGVRRCSDAGEPQGTAGMPVLKVIESNGLTDTCVVVTRYFGGILLGAGGLVRAYARAAALAIEASGKAQIVTAVDFALEYGYDLHNAVLRIVTASGAAILDQQFTDRVRLTASVEASAFCALKEQLSARFYTNIVIEETSRGFARRPV